MTPERLAEIRAREQAASPGPWISLGNHLESGPGDYSLMWSEDGAPCAIAKDADCYFITHARQDIPDLLAEVEALASDNATMRDGLARLECRVLQELVAAQPENKAPLEAIWRIARAALSGEASRDA